MGVCYLLWVLFLLHSHWASPRITSGWIWTSILTAPLTHIGAFAFMAPLPWILCRRVRAPWGFILGLVLSIFICELVAILLPLLDGWLYTQAHVIFDRARLLAVYVALVGPAMMVVGGLIAARVHAEVLRKASETEAQIAKNRLLQGQVHPHVLFNALNGLAELVHKDPKAAEGAIRHLSDLLRRILVATEHARLPLFEERKVVTDFLALEAIRLGDRLRVTWEWDTALDGLELPPLLLQPLVENAIKHGIAPSIPGGDLVLRAQAREGAIVLEVWNSGKPFRDTGGGGGIGVRNLRSRLALNFGDKASLFIGPSAPGTLARITIEATQVEFPHEAAESPGR
ncbi:MAG: histidine kinase-, gyrase and HSP90-like ATPase family protein [Holophagaceae bacterium]|nr:histidine kinase-, gyrase and HSP90-like ATPase family protein [Holophagaceae bacterium]